MSATASATTPGSSHRAAVQPAQPRSLPPIHSASLMQGPSGIALHLCGDGGAMTQVPLTLAALREIAALAGSALNSGNSDGTPARRPGIAAWQALLEGKEGSDQPSR